MPTTVAAAAHAAIEVSCRHSAIGATARSAPCGFCGCAAGHNCRPSDGGAARPPVETQDKAEETCTGGYAEPAGHVGHGPEQADELSPAELPKVPAGQREQNAAPLTAKVPGEQKMQIPPLLGRGHEPALHTNGDGEVVGDNDGVDDIDGVGDGEGDGVGEGETGVTEGEGVTDAESESEGVTEGVAEGVDVVVGVGSADDRWKVWFTSDGDNARENTRSSSRAPVKAQPLPQSG